MFFSFSFVSWGQIFGVFFAPFPEEEISDYIAHGPIIRVLAVFKTYVLYLRIITMIGYGMHADVSFLSLAATRATL